MWKPKRWDRKERNLLDLLFCEAISQAPARVRVHGPLRERSDGKGKLHQTPGPGIKRARLGTRLPKGRVSRPDLRIGPGDFACPGR